MQLTKFWCENYPNETKLHGEYDYDMNESGTILKCKQDICIEHFDIISFQLPGGGGIIYFIVASTI